MFETVELDHAIRKRDVDLAMHALIVDGDAASAQRTQATG